MNNKFFKILFLSILTVLTSSISYASSDNVTEPTVISINSNSQASVNLSETDINRLYVKDQKITSINFPDDALTSNNDASGAIYINLKINSPFTAFITTNLGLHFSLIIIPKSIPGKIIKFIAPIPKVSKEENQKGTVVIQHNSDAYAFEQSAPYERTLIRLIKDVELQKTPPGYTNIASKAFSQIGIFNLSGSVGNNAGLSQTVEAGFLGGELAVRVLKITNTTSKPVELFENEFYADGVRAVAIQQEYLKSNANTYVFEVVSNA